MDKKIKLQIKNRFTGNVVFEYESNNNTVKKTVEEAVKRDANLRGADLCGANLCGADLCGADLCDANLRDADLCDANLRDADLRDADLRDADLCDADLCDADLRDADLRDADLRDANLCDADLRGADLRDANLCGCVLDYDDDPNGYGDTDRLLKNLDKNAGIRVTTAYENHDTFASRWGCFWRNLIIIRKWELVDQQKDGIELPQDKAELLRAWLSQSKYPDKRFSIRKSILSNTLIITIANTDYSISLQTTATIDVEVGRKYTLNGNRIVKA